MCRLLRISGQSLQPGYNDGDFVIISKIPILFNRLKPGDRIVFKHVDYGLLIKTIDHFVFKKRYYVTGSHAFSVDSRQFGPVESQNVLGKVIWHIRRD